MRKRKYTKQKNNESTKGKKTQWHPAYCSATRLELKENKKDLDYHSEHGINTKPIQIDLLVIKKSKGVVIKNEIGKIFKGHNIFEYKSPDDNLSIDTYFKTLGYACLYKAAASKTNGILAHDITISFVREKKPRKLLRWFLQQGYEIQEKFKGIYYIKHNLFFDTQIIVLKELPPESHVWLCSLCKKIRPDVAEHLLIEINNLKQKGDSEDADSVLQVAMKQNKKMFSELKEEYSMCEELLKLMEPELTEAKKRAAAEGKLEGIAAGRAEGMAAGRAEGRAEGEDKLSTLINILLEKNMQEDIPKVTTDKIIRAEFYKKFGID